MRRQERQHPINKRNGRCEWLEIYGLFSLNTRVDKPRCESTTNTETTEEVRSAAPSQPRTRSGSPASPRQSGPSTSLR